MGRRNAYGACLLNDKPRGLVKKKKRRRRRKKVWRRTPMTEAQQALAADYLPMARAMARPLKDIWPGQNDEFESAACMALVEAAQSYDSSRKVIFATFARYRIWGALRDVQRSLITAGWHCEMDELPTFLSLEEGHEECGRVLNTNTDAPTGQGMEDRETVEHLLGKLPRKHAVACREIYLNNRTHSQVARIIGCTKSRVSYLLMESRAKLNGSAFWQSGSEIEYEYEYEELDGDEEFEDELDED